MGELPYTLGRDFVVVWHKSDGMRKGKQSKAPRDFSCIVNVRWTKISQKINNLLHKIK